MNNENTIKKFMINEEELDRVSGGNEPSLLDTSATTGTTGLAEKFCIRDTDINEMSDKQSSSNWQGYNTVTQNMKNSRSL